MTALSLHSNAVHKHLLPAMINRNRALRCTRKLPAGPAAILRATARQAMIVGVTACALLSCYSAEISDGVNKAIDQPKILQWETVDTDNKPVARHEASLVSFNKKIYLLGGRGLKPVNIYDPDTKRWTTGATPPLEIHHFQAVVLNQAIYLVGAMTGAWPNEVPLDRVLIYYPLRDEFAFSHAIPKQRRRGAAGAVVYKQLIYLIGGITEGHLEGSQSWLDVYNPDTGLWTALPDAPNARDHLQAAVINGQIHIQGGRRTHYRSGRSFELTQPTGNIYDITNKTWLAPRNADAIPTARAGHMVLGLDGRLVVAGGESGTQEQAHGEVEIFDPKYRRWRSAPALNRGRHGTGLAALGGYVYTASGSGKRGGEPELTSLERIPKAALLQGPFADVVEDLPVLMRHHPVTLSFNGPTTSETAEPNAFLDYRLDVTISHAGQTRVYRGFYAADGNSADTSAEGGGVWQVRFTPHAQGRWSYEASLKTGHQIALDNNLSGGSEVPISNPRGQFQVSPSDKFAPDFRANGPLTVDNGLFKFAATSTYWIKGGTNSPENLLGYEGFDGTYRMSDNVRDGEATAGSQLHTFEPHMQDWRLGDPVWAGGKGKSLIGAMNYLADQGMNAAYFLTLNIDGDGKDVWPFRDPTDYGRFDVSKLEQWNRVFSHMQRRGIALHLVLQETENELMFDGGDTGPQRQLYLHELIARFAHHPGLIWNLGEENGPVHWRPEGQNTAQRKAMASFLKTHDPDQHPVLLHTHSEAADKDKILNPLLGFKDLDGLSFQVADRTSVNRETRKWAQQSTDAGHRWLITMDEIGLWHTGAPPDTDDPGRDSLRRHALWGHLLAGGAGVEWYFGAQFPANDLTSEDWRLRAELWRQTRNALNFFQRHLTYWKMNPCSPQISDSALYCLSSRTGLFVVYQEGGQSVELTLMPHTNGYFVQHFDPVTNAMSQTIALNTPTGMPYLFVSPPPAGDQVIVLRPQ